MSPPGRPKGEYRSAQRALPNVALTPHVGGGTIEAQAAVEDMVCANIDAFVAGAPVPTPVPGTPAHFAVAPATTD